MGHCYHALRRPTRRWATRRALTNVSLGSCQSCNRMFTRELIQAISDFQRDAKSAKQKVERGARLKDAASHLSAEFKSCRLICYRQIALTKPSLWQLADELVLPEAISSWTIDLGVAQTLKGGVPPPIEYAGLIFGILPTSNSIVVNLSRLFRDPNFIKACSREARNVLHFANGTGRWWNKQSSLKSHRSGLMI